MTLLMYDIYIMPKSFGMVWSREFLARVLTYLGNALILLHAFRLATSAFRHPMDASHMSQYVCRRAFSKFIYTGITTAKSTILQHYARWSEYLKNLSHFGINMSDLKYFRGLLYIPNTWTYITRKKYIYLLVLQNNIKHVFSIFPLSSISI